MNIECVNCGKNFEVPDGLASGQHVRCPYCNEKSQIDMPSRIELPAGVPRRSASAEPPADPPATDSPAAVLTEAAPVRPRLAIRRPAGTPSDNAAVEAFRRRDLSRRRAERSRKVKKALSGFFSFLLVAAIGWIGYGVWKSHDKIVEVLPSVDDTAPSVAVVESEKRVEKERAAAAETARRAEAERVAAENSRLRERYGEAVEQFGRSRLSVWNLLARNRRPGVADGVVLAMIARTKQHQELYRLVTSNGTMSVSLITASDAEREVAKDTFMSLLNRNGGVFLVDDTAYAFRAKSTLQKWSAPLDGRPFCPSEAFFGDISPLLTSLSVNAAGVRYGVKMSFGEGTREVDVASVEHGESISASTFRKIAEERAREVRRDSLPSKLTTKRFRQTVFFYDGVYVVKGADGTVKVPRHWRQSGVRGHAEWLAYRREAERQESEVARYKRESAREIAELKAKLDGPIEKSLLDAVMASADVTVAVSVIDRN